MYTNGPRPEGEGMIRSRSPVVTDEAALRRLWDEHAGALLAYCVRLTGGDRGRAEDVVQETLLQAWRHPEALDPARGSARPWLLTVARRLVIDQWRGRPARPPPGWGGQLGRAARPRRGRPGVGPPP